MNKKVLIVTLHYLDGVGGGVFASRAYINAIAEIFREGEVTLLYPDAHSHTIQGIDSRVKKIPVRNNKPRLIKTIDAIRGQVHRNFDTLPEILEKEKFDLVIFDNSRASFRMIDIAHSHGAKVMTIHHNCEIEYVRDNSIPLLRPISLYWTKRCEQEAVIKSDLNLTLTPDDEILLKKHYPSKNQATAFEVIGTFESKQQTHINPLIESSAYIKNFVITGNLAARQTVQSLLPWLDNYFPVLNEEIPDIELTIAGNSPSDAIIEKCKDLGIRLIPSPKDMAPIINEADCYICPTNLGGGLKLRIMDGLRAGLPVITHQVSARGYHDFASAGALFTYNDVDSFRSVCRKVKHLNATPAYIRELYRQIFSFEAGVNRLKAAIQKLTL